MSARQASRVAFSRPIARGKKIAYVTTYPPRECGIATFTSDLSSAIATLGVFGRPVILAMHDPNIYKGPYTKEVKFFIQQHEKQSYIEAAEFVNHSDVSLVNLQHEFGIFGTDPERKNDWDGSYILEFLRHVKKPVVTTLHTVLKNPLPTQKATLQEVAERSARLVVMARNARRILEPVYGISRDKLASIHHGAPDIPFHTGDYFKRALGLRGREVLMTFGLLSPNKGIENVLEALRTIVPQYPQIMYLVVGVTHPVVRREFGEKYRRELQHLVRKYGLTENVRFVNQYLTLNQLILFLRGTNIYLAPQLDPEQYVSGTLAYAAAFGKAIISTKFRYARYLLRHDRGILVPPKDPKAIAEGLEELLSNPQRKRDVEEAVYIYSRKMTWPYVASKYADLFRKVIVEATGDTETNGGT